MTTTTKIIKTYRLSPEELEDAILSYLEKQEEVSEELQNGNYTLNYLARAVAYDQYSGRVSDVRIEGVELAVYREE